MDHDWRLLPLRCGAIVHAAVVHRQLKDQPVDRDQLDALSRTWSAAIMAAVQHDGARRLGEQLAQANAILSETQDELTRARALAAVGEVAAGAAHEMNNPLTVICGRAQILSSRVEDKSLRSMASQIADASHELSDMITALRRLAEPLRLQKTSVNLPLLLDVAIQTAVDQAGRELTVERQVPDDKALAHVHVDGQQFADAVGELIRNALESEGSSHVTVRVQIDAHDDRLILQVIDDGNGLTDHALAHAFEPFFSAKPAGRQPGLGLARVRRIIEAHGGKVTLRNAGASGAIATIHLSHWRNTGKHSDAPCSMAPAGLNIA
jgi:signal transduction histidine kinase